VPCWINIHASLGKPDKGEQRTLAALLDGEWETKWGSYTKGAIVGMFHVSCVKRAVDVENDPQAVGPLCWCIDEVVRFSPIACTGKLGLWQLPANIAAGLVRA